jgi:hypothetical protein
MSTPVLPTVQEQLAALPEDAVLNAYGVSTKFAENNPDLVQGAKWAVVLGYDKNHYICQIHHVTRYEITNPLERKPNENPFIRAVHARDPKEPILSFGYTTASRCFDTQEEAAIHRKNKHGLAFLWKIVGL